MVFVHPDVQMYRSAYISDVRQMYSSLVAYIWMYTGCTRLSARSEMSYILRCTWTVHPATSFIWLVGCTRCCTSHLDFRTSRCARMYADVQIFDGKSRWEISRTSGFVSLLIDPSLYCSSSNRTSTSSWTTYVCRVTLEFSECSTPSFSISAVL